MKKTKIGNVKLEQELITELPLIDTTSSQPFTKPHVSGSLQKQFIIDEIDKRINRLYNHSKKVKGIAERKSYEDTCTSFVLFKIWVQEQ